MKRFNPLRNLYNRYNLDKKKRRDLNLVAASGSLFMIFFPITAGAPMAGFAQELGAGDFFYSVLMALPIMGSLLQIITSWIIEKTGKRKKLFITFGVVSRFLWTSVGLVPILILSNIEGAIGAVIVIITLSSLLNSFMSVGFYSWMGDLIPIRVRGKYLGIKDSIATLVGLVSALVIARTMDTITGLDAYAVIFAVAGIFGTIDIFLFVFVTDVPMQRANHDSLTVVLSRAMKNKKFVKFLLFWTGWIFSFNIANPFYNMYTLGSLGLSFTQVIVGGQVAFSLTSALTSPRWGRWLDKFGYRWVLMRVGVTMSILPLLWLPSAKGVLWPFIVFSLGSGLFLPGINTSASKMLMTATPDRNRSMYVAIYMLVTQLLGTMLGYLSGGALLELMGDFSIVLGRIQMDRYKILFLGAGVLRFVLLMALLPGISHDMVEE